MLRVSQLTAAYGSAQVLNGVDLELGHKEIVALLGRNGMGKTTLMKSLMAIVPVSGGRVRLGERDITGLRTHEIAKSGVGYVPQGRGIFDKLTVEENLRMGMRALPNGAGGVPEFLYEQFPILRERRAQVAGTLSGGQKQQLAISRALCSNPKVLLLDEPSEGVQPNIVQELGVFLRGLVDRHDIAVLIVEQNLELVHQTADRFDIMVKGRIVHSGANSELDDQGMLQRFLSV